LVQLYEILVKFSENFYEKLFKFYKVITMTLGRRGLEHDQDFLSVNWKMEFKQDTNSVPWQTVTANTYEPGLPDGIFSDQKSQFG
jgi:hypothetical protein